MRRYATIYKRLGETPLEATERLRATLGLPREVPLAYAGRLDPMARGKLLILIGEECKRQVHYHALDKEYLFSILFGVSSDSGDILGILSECEAAPIAESELRRCLTNLIGEIELPYPHFSSKTVSGKPLHIWTLQKRLHEIEIPTKRSTIYRLEVTGMRIETRTAIATRALAAIETVTEVHEASKQLGRNFRRTEVRASWRRFFKERQEQYFTIATLRCIASSGTYMRSLAEHIAARLGTCGLALNIERNRIGRYVPLGTKFGVWLKQF